MKPGYPKTFQSDLGNLELIPATHEQLRAIARCWPMELIERDDAQGSYGLVFQHGDLEIHGIKLQPVDTSKTDANVILNLNRALIAAALSFYLEKQHRGVMLPCAYIKEKTTGLFESGIALFVGPDAENSASNQLSPNGSSGQPTDQPVRGLLGMIRSWFMLHPTSTPTEDALYDEELGAGATQMIFDMMRAIAKASKEADLPMTTIIGVDLRPRLAIGGIAMDCLVEGPNVIVVKEALQEDDPIWMFLVEHIVSAGFSTLPHAPMQPVSLPGSLPPDTPRA